MKIHIVQKGDTLWKIAKKYGVNFEELKKMNSQLSNPDMIMPGMKVKVPTTGGSVHKNAGSHNPGVKKEQPIVKEAPIAKEMPIKEMPIKEMPIKEAPIKEIPIKEVPIKEAPITNVVPNVPYTPKMPLQIVPEIDINNYYTMNMANMTVQQPPNVLPEIKEVPKEVPKKEMPVVEAPVHVEAPPPPPLPVDCCVPVTPILPGPGFCPPYEPFMPFYQVQPAAYTMNPGYMQPMTGYMPAAPIAQPAPQAAYIPPHFDDESSSFLPQMQMMNPGYNPGAAMGVQQPSMYGNPAGQYPAGQYPAGGYQMMPGAYPGEVPTGYAGMPAGYPEGYAGAPTGFPAGYTGVAQTGYPAVPGAGYPMEYAGGYPAVEYPQGAPGSGFAPGGAAPYGATPYGASPYGQIPYGYPQMSGIQPGIPEVPGGAYRGEGIPVGTGTADCGCGQVPVSQAAAEAELNQQVPFVPPTPPIYSAPYTGSINVAQPPFMNPYGMGTSGAYGLPRYDEESND